MWMWIECKVRLQLARIDFEMSSVRTRSYGTDVCQACLRVYSNLLLHSIMLTTVNASEQKCQYTIGEHKRIRSSAHEPQPKNYQGQRRYAT